MSTTERAQPLAGLVDPAAAALYQRLRAGGPKPLGTSPGEVDPRSAATMELLDLGLAFQSGNNDGMIQPVGQAVALRLLIEHRQDELIRHQRRILEGWSRLNDLLPSETGGNWQGPLAGITPLTEFDQVLTKAAEIYPSARIRVRATESGVGSLRPNPVRGRTPAHTDRGGDPRVQLICPAGSGAEGPGADLADEAARRGGEIRFRRDVPVRMLHIDDSVALVSTDRAASTALLVHAPVVLAMLAEWFDLLWDDAATVDPRGGSALTYVQRRVLELMAFEGDEAVARRLNLSITTVRRHVKAIYTALRVDNRFAAGVAAAKRGWL